MKVGCAAVFQNQQLLKRLPNESSIYCAEAIVIDLAMNIIANHKSSKFIIYSDSKSVLQALQSKDSSTPLITRLLDKMNTLSKKIGSFLLGYSATLAYREMKEQTKLQKSTPDTYIQYKNSIHRPKTILTNLYSRNGKILGIIKCRTNSTIFKIP